MDTKKHNTSAGLPQSELVACSFSGSSAFSLVSPRMAKLFATIEHTLSAIPVIRENRPNLTTTLLSSPCRISYGMLNAMTNLTKRLITNPLHAMTDYYGSRERIVSLTQRISGLVDNLRFYLSSTSEKRDEPCTLMHLNQLANQLQQLAENVANLQETNEEFKSKYQQENLLAEVGDMKVYLELLYQQLKQDELKKIQIEEENIILRQSVGKYSIIDGPTNWDIRRESDGTSDKLSNFYGLNPLTQLNTACLESKGKNPPANIETSMDEFRLKISYLYQEGSIAWARPPKKGDTIVFTFHQPVLLKRFKLGTGHYEYPINKLSDATVEILLMSSDLEIKNLVVTSDDYLVVGKFDDSGLAEGMIDWHTLGTVQRLRVNIQSNHQNWVVMSELLLETVPLMGENTQSEDDFESW
uniref:MGAT4 A/B/C C-terminal domain-containing protein n=1 Tax=Daphnia galeata TaxID=27404 RepID=A0A8J2RZR1_9CRUS|nr:unnamed protein product [Daphnia galeata]